MACSPGPWARRSAAARRRRCCGSPFIRSNALPDRFDLLIGIDWLNAHRFGAEIKAGPQTLVISDPRGGDLPPMVTQSGARVVEVPMKEMAKAIPDGRPNMIALGIAGRLLGFTVEQVVRADREAAGRQGAGRHRGEPRRHQGRLSAPPPASHFGLQLRQAETEQRPPLAAVGQRGDRARRHPRRHPLRRRLSDHAGDRSPRMAGAEP